MQLSIGVDLGFGVKSATAVCIIDTEFDILKFFQVTPGLIKDHSKKLQYISTVVGKNLRDYFGTDYDRHRITITIEKFVMQGPSGQTLQQLMGAVISHIPSYMEVKHYHNISLKKTITGSGKAQKIDMANSLIEIAHKYRNRPTIELLEKWKESEEWDLIDAAALAYTGIM